MSVHASAATSLPTSPFGARDLKLFGIHCTEAEASLSGMAIICGDEDLNDLTFVASVPVDEITALDRDEYDTDASFLKTVGDTLLERVLWKVKGDAVIFESTSAAQTAYLLNMLTGAGVNQNVAGGVDVKRLGTMLRRKRSNAAGTVIAARHAEAAAAEAAAADGDLDEMLQI